MNSQVLPRHPQTSDSANTDFSVNPVLDSVLGITSYASSSEFPQLLFSTLPAHWSFLQAWNSQVTILVIHLEWCLSFCAGSQYPCLAPPPLGLTRVPVSGHGSFPLWGPLTVRWALPAAGCLFQFSHFAARFTLGLIHSVSLLTSSISCHFAVNMEEDVLLASRP